MNGDHVGRTAIGRAARWILEWSSDEVRALDVSAGCHVDGNTARHAIYVLEELGLLERGTAMIGRRGCPVQVFRHTRRLVDERRSWRMSHHVEVAA